MSPNDAITRLAVVPAIITRELPHERVEITADGFTAIVVFDSHANRWRFQPGTGRPSLGCHFSLRRLISDVLNPQEVTV